MAHIRTRQGKRGTTYEVRFRDPSGRESQQTFRRKSDAQRFARDIEAAKDSGRYFDPRRGRQTLRSYFGEWLERQTLAPRSVDSARLAVESAPFMDWQLRQIDRAAIERWVAGMSRDGFAPLTVRTRLGSVRRVLRAAVHDGILSADPTAGVKAPRSAAAEELVIPSADDVRALLAHLHDPFRLMAMTAALSGLRLGEVCGLQPQDVDADAGVLRVRRQAQPTVGEGMGAVPPKSRSSVRDVPIPAELVAALTEASDGRSPDDWLFPSSQTGAPWRPASTHRAITEACAAAGVEMGWHSLRHYYASSLLRQGLDAVTVAHALGHSSPAVTLSTYAHVMPDHAERVRQASEVLAGSLANAGESREGRT